MTEHRYRYLGGAVRADHVLPELAAAAGTDVVRWRIVHQPLDPCRLPLLHGEPVAAGADDDFLEVRRDGAGRLHLEFPGRARFAVDGDTVRAQRLDGAGDAEFRHLLLDHVLPRLEGQTGRVVLHAAAVAGPGGAVVLLGETGRGKSTVATCLARAGWPLLTDDAVALDLDPEGSVVAQGAYPGVRLWPAGLAVAGIGADAGRPVSSAGKRRLADDGTVPTATGPHPLAGFVLLGDADADEDAAATAPVPPTALFEELQRHRFVVDPEAVPVAIAFDVAARSAVVPAIRLAVTGVQDAAAVVRARFAEDGGGSTGS